MAKRIREKAAKRLENRDKRPQATAKFVRISPSKVHIVLDIIRGQDYNNALAILKNTPKAASEVLVKVLESAGANAENNLNMSKNDLFVAECFANEGPTYKRHWLRSRGSADIIKKRTSHITIILDEKGKTAPVSKPKVEKTEVKTEEKAVKAKTSTKKTVSKTAKKVEVKAEESAETTNQGGEK
ncbi:MAG: 50S ribosomal protein L22 [Clostridia bacterium]|nr:50S ribosomal protein L22 [Clostridia bacterium]